MLPISAIEKNVVIRFIYANVPGIYANVPGIVPSQNG